MRDILFRGKRVDNGEWVYGYYCKSTKHWHKHGIHNDWIITSALQNGGFFNVMQRYAVIPETVGMWTGLTDKNGKRIFQGDKVKFLGKICEVVFEIGVFGIVNNEGFDYDPIESAVKSIIASKNYDGCRNDNFISLWELYWNFDGEEDCIDEVEVIGNINDNEGV